MVNNLTNYAGASGFIKDALLEHDSNFRKSFKKRQVQTLERISQDTNTRQDYLNLTNRTVHRESGLSVRTRSKPYKISSLVKSTISSEMILGVEETR